MEGVEQVDAFVVERAAHHLVEAVEHDVVRLRRKLRHLQNVAQRHAGPLADRGPALVAIMLGDLGACRHRLELVEGKRQLPFNKTVDREPPAGELRDHHLEIGESGRHFGAVGRKIRRDQIGCVFAHQRLAGE